MIGKVRVWVRAVLVIGMAAGLGGCQASISQNIASSNDVGTSGTNQGVNNIQGTNNIDIISATPAPAAPSAVPTPGSAAPSFKPLIGKTDTAVRQATSFDKQIPARIEPSVPPGAQSFYFSYDDSASTASVALTKLALRENRKPDAALARPWEFLNFERFDRAGQEPTGLFKVSMGLWDRPSLDNPREKTYELGVHVSGPELTHEQRKPLNLTILADLAGFYTQPATAAADDSPRQLARQGLELLADKLKAGDTLNWVQAGQKTVTILENWAYDRQDLFTFTRQIRLLDYNSPNRLKEALAEAYRLALKSYDPRKSNRILLLSDLASQDAPPDLEEMARQTRINNQEGIYFSAVGFGNFNDKLLNRLSEAGSGAYFAVQDAQDARRVFSERFVSLVDIAAKQVTFRLDYPAALKRRLSAAEQSSARQSEVLPTNFSYNTSQFFWETFASEKEFADLFGQEVKLWIFYLDPASKMHKAEFYAKTLGGLRNAQLENIKDAHLIYLLTTLIKGDTSPEMAQSELDKLFANHETALGKEYKGLIQAWGKIR